MIYFELEKRNHKNMSNVLIWGSGAAVGLYTLVGIFGYVTFVDQPEAFAAANILEAPYGKNIPITIVRIVEHYELAIRETLHCSSLYWLLLHSVFSQQRTVLKNCF